MGLYLTEPSAEEMGRVRQGKRTPMRIGLQSIHKSSKRRSQRRPITGGAETNENPKMGDAPNLFRNFSFSRSALDPKGKTTCSCAVYLQIVDFRMRKELFDCWFEFSVGHIFLSDEAATARVGLNGARTSAQLLGKTGVLRMTRASIGVNIDRTGLRQRFDAGETNIGKENSAVLVCDDGAQAVPAR